MSWSDRHTVVVRLVAEGKSNKDIAHALNIPYNHAAQLVTSAANLCGIRTQNRRVGLAHWYLRGCSGQERDRILYGRSA